jgi:hypothetical protein
MSIGDRTYIHSRMTAISPVVAGDARARLEKYVLGHFEPMNEIRQLELR